MVQLSQICCLKSFEAKAGNFGGGRQQTSGHKCVTQKGRDTKTEERDLFLHSILEQIKTFSIRMIKFCFTSTEKERL